ncbi:GIY-YIG nuclease family protein [Type-E symbiont of Plautia stali]|uniref:GIY-YIG nuclease family protein n=1 Tax=Type-E symbiont of Plautia stali TaxID=1560357 RepID=UPI00073E9654|nr:GIY-YIG nuclease family protein [Type-E symbiont of Plautia stali]
MNIPSTWSWVRKGETPHETWQHYYNVKEEDVSKVFGDYVITHRREKSPFWTDGKVIIAEFDTPKQLQRYKGAKIVTCLPATLDFNDINGLVIVESTFHQRGRFFIGLITTIAQLDGNCVEMPSFKDIKRQVSYYESFYPKEELVSRIQDQLDNYNELDDARIELASAKALVSEAKKRIKNITTKAGLNLIRTFGFDRKRPGELYILKSNDGNYIKIGIAQNASQRHAQLARSTPWAFTVLITVQGSGEAVYEAESRAHKLLEADNAAMSAKAFNGATEWFHSTPAVLAYVEKIIAEGLDA